MRCWFYFVTILPWLLVKSFLDLLNQALLIDRWAWISSSLLLLVSLLCDNTNSLNLQKSLMHLLLVDMLALNLTIGALLTIIISEHGRTCYTLRRNLLCHTNLAKRSKVGSKSRKWLHMHLFLVSAILLTCEPSSRQTVLLYFFESVFSNFFICSSPIRLQEVKIYYLYGLTQHELVFIYLFIWIKSFLTFLLEISSRLNRNSSRLVSTFVNSLLYLVNFEIENGSGHRSNHYLTPDHVLFKFLLLVLFMLLFIRSRESLLFCKECYSLLTKSHSSLGWNILTVHACTFCCRSLLVNSFWTYINLFCLNFCEKFVSHRL